MRAAITTEVRGKNNLPTPDAHSETERTHGRELHGHISERPHGGATLGSALADQIRDRNEGTPLGDMMAPIAAEIEEDRQALDDLMEALDVGRNPVKQVGGLVAEKMSRIKFSGVGSGDASTATSWRSVAGARRAREAISLGRLENRRGSARNVGETRPGRLDRTGRRPARCARASPDPDGHRRTVGLAISTVGYPVT